MPTAYISTLTSSVDVEETIPTEMLPAFCLAYNEAPQLARTVGSIISVPRGSGNVVRIPRWNQIDASAWVAHTAGDLFEPAEATTTEESLTGQVVGRRFFVDRRAEDDSVTSVSASMLSAALDALRTRMEIDLFAQVDNITLEHDASGGAFTAQALRGALAAWELTVPSTPPAIVITPAAWNDLVESLSSTGAVAMTGAPILANLLGSTPGYRGELHGCQIFVSSNLAVDTGVASGVITGVGAASGLVTAIWHDASAQLSQRPEAYGAELVVSARYACGLKNNHATRPAAMRVLVDA